MDVAMDNIRNHRLEITDMNNRYRITTGMDNISNHRLEISDMNNRYGITTGCPRSPVQF